MNVAVVKETFPGERRVALVPAVAPPLVKAGLDVLVESEAGQAAGFADKEYVQKGARLAVSRPEALDADVLLQVRTFPANSQAGRSDLEHLRPGQTILGFADPLGQPAAVAELAARGVTLLALELIPRITRAQSMDALSSMASVAGYRAVLAGATALTKMFPMMMTAAGTLSAAKVLVIGAGVAGLAAIATARRLGAIVRAYDVRPAVKEQVESLGAKFVDLGFDTAQAEGAGGYAKALSEDFYRRQQEALGQVVGDSDLVIATAAVPGRRSPVLVTRQAVERMHAGSAIVDLAAERGGNCELTRPDQTIVHGGVTILGPTNLASDAPYHASQMYARNITALLLHVVKDGKLELDSDDPIVADTLVCRDGRVVHAKVREMLGGG